MKTTIGVFFGGRSTEHEISILSANQAMHAIDRDVYDVIPVYIAKDGLWYTGYDLFDIMSYRNLPALLKRCKRVYMRAERGDFNLYTVRKPWFGSGIVATLDVALPVLHGMNGEDGTFQGVLDTIGLPYAGCDTLASANGMDKITMKMILSSQGIPVVNYVWFTDKQWVATHDSLIERVETELTYPVIVKPSNLGSSIGISKAANRDELDTAVAEACKYASRIIVERMVQDMQEINCSVLGDCDDYETSVLEEPITADDFLTFEEKYGGGGGKKGAKGMAASLKKFPADLPEDITKRIQFLAGETFRVLSCHGVSRVDVMIEGTTGEIFVNEINTIPGSLSFYLWDNLGKGIDFTRLIDRLVKLALKRAADRERKVLSFDSNVLSMAGGAKGMKGVKGTKGAKRQ